MNYLISMGDSAGLALSDNIMPENFRFRLFSVFTLIITGGHL